MGGGLSVGQRLAIIPLVMLLALGCQWYLSQKSLDTLRNTARAADLIGRQRFLGQRYIKEVLLARLNTEWKEPYGNSAQAWSETGQLLVQGGVAVTDLISGEAHYIPPPASQEVRDALEASAQQARLIVEQGEALKKLSPQDPGYAARFKEFLDLGPEYHKRANLSVRTMFSATDRSIEAMTRLQAIITAALGLLVIGLSLVITRQITVPLEKLVGAATQMAQGNLVQEPVMVHSQDEVGQLSRAFNHMMSSLRELVSQTVAAGENLNAAAAQILSSTQEQAAGTTEQLAAVHQTTATLTEVCQAGAQISERARSVGAAAERGSDATVAGLQAVQSSAQSMESIREQVELLADRIISLSDKTQAVGEIIGTVNEVAERSNLLALNAALEAAGAGEEGRRFSVVANELKNLADRSKQSTVQVRTILNDIQKGIHGAVMFTEEAVKRVESGRAQSDRAETTIRQAADSTNESIQAFQQIAAATNQQQIGFDQVTQAANSIRIASEQTATGIRQLEAAATNLGALAQQLSKAVERFKV